LVNDRFATIIASMLRTITAEVIEVRVITHDRLA